MPSEILPKGLPTLPLELLLQVISHCTSVDEIFAWTTLRLVSRTFYLEIEAIFHEHYICKAKVRLVAHNLCVHMPFTHWPRMHPPNPRFYDLSLHNQSGKPRNEFVLFATDTVRCMWGPGMRPDHTPTRVGETGLRHMCSLAIVGVHMPLVSKSMPFRNVDVRFTDGFGGMAGRNVDVRFTDEFGGMVVWRVQWKWLLVKYFKQLQAERQKGPLLESRK